MMYKNKISAVSQIINTVTGDRYVGSSKHVMRRAGIKHPTAEAGKYSIEEEDK